MIKIISQTRRDLKKVIHPIILKIVKVRSIYEKDQTWIFRDDTQAKTFYGITMFDIEQKKIKKYSIW